MSAEEAAPETPSPPDMSRRPGWRANFDAGSGNYYFDNLSTGEVTWTIPEEVALPEPEEIEAASFINSVSIPALAVELEAGAPVADNEEAPEASAEDVAVVPSEEPCEAAVGAPSEHKDFEIDEEVDFSQYKTPGGFSSGVNSTPTDIQNGDDEDFSAFKTPGGAADAFFSACDDPDNAILKQPEEDFSAYKSPGGAAAAFAPTEEDFSAFKTPGGIDAFKQPSPKNSIPTAAARFEELGRQAVITAVFEGNPDLVFKLLEAGAPVNAVDVEGITNINNKGAAALFIASRGGHVASVQVLLNAGANVDMPKGNSGVTSLHIACWHAQTEVIEALLKAGASPDIGESHGATALFIASQRGHTHVVKMLLKGGASIDVAKSNGATPLFIACEHGHIDVIKMLLMFRANVNLSATRPTNDAHKVETLTPLYVTCRTGLFSDVIELLILARAQVDFAKEDGRTPWSIAQECGHKPVIEMLSGYVAIAKAPAPPPPPAE